MWIVCLLQLFILNNIIFAQPPTCIRSSKYLVPQTPGDNGFRITVEGSFKAYVPGRTYKLTLNGFKNQFYQASFKEFMIIAVPSTWSDEQPYRPIGHFELLQSTNNNDDSMQEAVISQRNCPGGVTDANPDKLKNSISIDWIAPRHAQGCVSFKATVVRSDTTWFKDENALTYTMCEDQMHIKKMMQQCCACGEAKYQLTFKGLWSPKTHKTAWPSSTVLAHFSTTVGAVHNSNYSMFQVGSYAHRGLSELVLTGETHTLEQELANEQRKGSVGLRFFITDTWWRQAIRVNRDYHQISLINKYVDENIESADSFIGVDAINLCLSNCTWIEQYSEDLYPLDAGIDSGNTYTSSRLPTLPLEKIHTITATVSPTSPFHDPMSKPMMPVARVTLQRTLVRGAQCPNNQPNTQNSHRTPNNLEDSSSDIDLSHEKHRNERLKQKYDYSGNLMYAYEETSLPDCRLTEWSPWSSCSVSCGHGIKTRRRAYVMPDKAFRRHCNQRTYDMASCQLTACSSAMTNDHSKSTHNAMCMASEWSAWSHCSVTCGTGMRTRSRTMLKGRDNAQCQLEYQLMEKETCHGMKPACEQGRLTDMIEKKRICMQLIEVGSCTQYERRFYFNLDMSKCLEFDYSGCGANDNNFLTRDACEDTCDILLRGRTEDGKDTRCMTLPWSEWSACSSVCGQGTQVRFRAYKVKFLAMGFCAEPLEEFRDCNVPCDPTQMYRLSDSRKTMIKSMEAAEKKDKCMQPLEPGPCTKFIERFYFDVTTRKCTKFQYGGCRGNENNFMAHDECNAMCDELIRDHKPMVHDPRCLISMWSEWSSCMNATCHRPGTQTRTRMYADKRAAMIAQCGESLEEQQRCTLDCNDNVSKNKQKDMMNMPKVMHRPRNPCCACDEAKYQLTFHGLWSKQTHPKDWPPEHLLHWSDIIGTVHSDQYSLWNYGDTASDGLKQIAEWGAIGTMQKEIKNHTKFGVIRNIMVVPGLWTVNVSKSTAGAFTTSKNHHFLSFVTMLGPSPDWVAGVSALDLCLPDCTWMDSYEELLHPIDAGTDMGIRYDGPKRPEIQRKPIAPILSSNITDQRSPFFGSQPPPFAKVSIKRIMVQGVACPNGRPQHSEITPVVDFGPNFADLSRMTETETEKDIAKTDVEILDEQSSDPRCMTSSWSAWSSCNVKCGNGLRTRTRMYKNPNHHECNERLSESEMCHARSGEECDDENQQVAPCTVTDWSSFSPCSVTCGQGVTERRRWYINENSHHDSRCKDIHLTEKRQCQNTHATDCGSTENEERCKSEPVADNRCRGLERYYYNKTSMACEPFAGNSACPARGNNKNNFANKMECETTCNSLVVQNNDLSCSMSPWSTWSECSVTCGRNGVRRRSRTLLNNHRAVDQYRCQSLPLEEVEPCHLNRCPPTDCVVSQWSAWSSCTGCGQDAIQTRIRIPVRRARNGGMRCGPLKEIRYCQTTIPC
ncbi:unnamed protein product [Rotaria socialis]|uniref:Spondin-1 n=4 Tax=Rotaria socialis TaxID=392032 RepID=A0A820KZU3_9BILA|nr:unnamed protein product [Rotaria socialis]CAF4348099.1 unnamed protein product [Rotaria socialis]